MYTYIWESRAQGTTGVFVCQFTSNVLLESMNLYEEFGESMGAHTPAVKRTFGQGE